MTEALPIWPLRLAGEALEALARAAGLPVRQATLPPAPAGLEEAPAWGAWLDAVSPWLGLELEAVSAAYPEVPALLLRGGPALVRLPGKPGFLALLGGRGDTLRLLGPDLRRHRVPLEAVRAALCHPLETRASGPVDTLLREAGCSGKQEARARAHLYRSILGGMTVEGCWLVRLPPSASFAAQLRAAGVHGAAATLLASHMAEVILSLLAWATVGRGALDGQLDLGWLLAWGLLLLTGLPFRALTVWAQGQFSIGFGGLLKRRLLLGALRLAPDEVRHEGAGQFLGRVIESEAVEALALTGGLGAALSGIELAFAGWVLSQGAGGWGAVALLAAWAAVSVMLAGAWLRRRLGWTTLRLDITHDLVERMVGHRTRLAQQAPARWHLGEDEALTRYLGRSEEMDRQAALLTTVVPRGWMLVGLLGLAPALLAGGDAQTALAVGVGGVFLAQQALASLTGGLVALGGAWIAGRQVIGLYQAAARPQVLGSPAFAVPSAHASSAAVPVIEAHGLDFRYPNRGAPVLRGCDLRVSAGDRILLEGPSGGGKSTLASVLVGLRAPTGGLLLLDGLDRPTLGAAGWRRRVVAAPQFHENHVLQGTFAFNLLLGRSWPPGEGDLEEAEALCHALGLGPLLANMPSGLLQMVGETGWQLSHGERSRLFLARALLQGADLVVLDESFAALDPENLALALRATLERAPALVVIAHP